MKALSYFTTLLLVAFLACWQVMASPEPDYTRINADSLEDVIASIKGDNIKLAQNVELLGKVYENRRDYKLALENFLQALKIYEELKNENGIGSIYADISRVYEFQKNYAKAVEYSRKGLMLKEKANNKYDVAQLYLQLATLFEKKGDIRTAREYNLKALEIGESLRDDGINSNALGNLAGVYLQLGNYQEAQDYALRSLENKRSFNDKKGMAYVLNTLGTIYTRQKQYDKAINYFKEALQTAREVGARELELNLNASMFEYYELKGLYKEALVYHKNYEALEDSIFKAAQNRQVAELEAKYETTFKDKQIAQLQKKQEEQEAERKRQQMFLWFVAGIAVIIGIAGLLLFRDYKKLKASQAEILEKKKEVLAKNSEIEAKQAEILKKKEEILAKNSELEVKQAEILEQSDNLQFAYNEITQVNNELKQQREEIEKQNLELRHKSNQINESLIYAKDLQEAMLPTEIRMNTAFAEHFAIYQAKDVVSGDFYWLSNEVNGKFVLAAADCTGHGVTGALLSTIGTSLLSKIVNERGITEPAKILQMMDEEFAIALHQNEKERTDGMDLAICTIDKANKTIEYAGAEAPIFFIKDGVLEELKAAPKHIGSIHRYRHNKVEFNTTKIEYTNSIALYLFSDGYSNQFGGVPYRKFTREGLKKAITEVHQRSMSEQKTMLEVNLRDWMVNTEPEKAKILMDDVLLIGVKV